MDPRQSRAAGPQQVISRQFVSEWMILRTTRPNVLITGQRATTEAVATALLQDLGLPVFTWTPGVALPPAHGTDILLIHDVGTLSLDEQHTLLSWLNQAAALGHTQVVSTTTFEVFPLIGQGLFLDTLYYRLNTIRLDMLD
jgi:hypothetical protein